VKNFRRLVLVLLLITALILIGKYSGRLLPRGAAEAIGASAEPLLDSVETVAWKKANPWLFNDTAVFDFRDKILLPMALEDSLGPRSLKRRGGFMELTFPRGRPVHVIALELEGRAARAGYRVAEGREVGNTSDQVEYALADASGRIFAVRIVLGQAVLPGAFRLALVITDWARADAVERRAWLDFPYAVTLVLPDTIEAPERDNPTGAERAVLVELPMEPAAYPHVKPGPRALFIDQKPERIESLLRERLDMHPEAIGFATRYGDRAIEHPGLMGTVLGFSAAQGLLFLDLTGSSRSQTQPVSLSTGAESYATVVRDPGSESELAEDLARRAKAARRSGEGVWVLRHTPGLPAMLARVLRAPPAPGETAPRWVTLKKLHRPDEE
jgi:polysaccharide deacetylase 2 family uncharacterized protein YibQ